MKKKKLDLNALKVQSFVTKLDNNTSKTLKGAESLLCLFSVDGYDGCSGYKQMVSIDNAPGCEVYSIDNAPGCDVWSVVCKGTHDFDICNQSKYADLCPPPLGVSDAPPYGCFPE